MPDTPSQTELLELTAEVVSAHASNNTVAASDLPQVIKDVYATFSTLGVAAPADRAADSCRTDQKIGDA